MNFSFRTMAALCSVAVTLTSGCRNIHDDLSYTSDAVSPLFSSEQQGNDNIVPEQVSQEEFVPAADIDCSVSFGEDHIGIRGEGAYVDGKSAVISSGGVYSVSGECADGRVLIESDEPVSLVLAGLTLKSSDSVIEKKGKGTLTLTVSADSSNLISGDGTAVDVQGRLVINGSGELDITGQTALNCGELRLCGADLGIKAEKDAIVSGGHVIAAAGETVIYSGGDGVKVTSDGANSGYVSISDGAFRITSAGDGIHAQTAVFVSGGELKANCGGGSTAVMFIDNGGRYPNIRHGGFSAAGSDKYDFGDLVSGDGSMVVSKKGIRCDGLVEISGGSVDISSADDSISARMDMIISDGIVTLATGDDGIHSDKSVIIKGGSISVTDSYTAVEGMSVDIDDGNISLNSRLDGIVSAGGSNISVSGGADGENSRYVSVSGGVLTIQAGGDGIDSAGNAAVSGGSVTVFSSAEDYFGSLRYEDSFAVSGGELAAFGSANGTMAPAIVSGPCISVYASEEKGSVLELTDSKGTVLFSRTLPSACGSVIFASEKLVTGESYTLKADGRVVAQVRATDGLCGGGPDGSETGGMVGDITEPSSSNAVAA